MNRATQALLDEYQKSIRELIFVIQNISNQQLCKIVDHETPFKRSSPMSLLQDILILCILNIPLGFKAPDLNQKYLKPLILILKP